MARKPAQQPATAYDYRRIKTLVDILATGDSAGLMRLAEGWGVDYDPSLEPQQYLVTRLARHAQQHARDQVHPPAPPQPVILDVPFYSQQPANPYVNDCGPACVRMLWGYWRQQRKLDDARDVTVQDFAQQILTSPRDTANNADLVKLAARYGMTLVSSNGPELYADRLRQELDAGHPVIALVMYDKLTEYHASYDKRDFAHYIVIIGYHPEGRFYYFDPLDTDGVQNTVSWAQLERALNPGPNKYFSVPYQGVFYRG